jgi:hypothetical protein
VFQYQLHQFINAFSGSEAQAAQVVIELQSELPVSVRSYHDSLERDPSLRSDFVDQSTLSNEALIDKYIELGPFQPNNLRYPPSETGKKFQVSWYKRYWWLEFSPSEKSAYCFACFLFSRTHAQSGSNGTFITSGFRNWKHALEKGKGFVKHDSSRDHNAAVTAMNLRKSKVLPTMLSTLDTSQKNAQSKHIVAAAKTALHLARQGLAFRGHDERADSFNRGNFLETLDFLIQNDPDLQQALKSLPQNAKYTSPDTQKELVKAGANLVRQHIQKELNDRYFCIIVDEARCSAKKEWMSIVLRFVDDSGAIVERFAGAVHVQDTKSETLFQEVLNFLEQFGLDIGKLRGQAFDGASNMRGEFNGLQALIRSKAPLAFYVHCFAHRLNLVVVAVAEEIQPIAKFFHFVQEIFNVCGASCKRSDALRDSHAANVLEALGSGSLATGRGQNQMMSLGLISSTRWNCRISALRSIANMYPAICDVLAMVAEDASSASKRVEANVILDFVSTFEFAFGLSLMTEVLGITNALSMMLQKKNQDYVNACATIAAAKNDLQSLRECFQKILDATAEFCQKNGIPVPEFDGEWKQLGRRGRGRPVESNGRTFRDYYKLEVFLPVIDKLQCELDFRFNDELSRIMELASCLQPKDSFRRFDPESIMKLSLVYKSDFPETDRVALDSELRNFKSIIGFHPDFRSGIETISDALAALISTGLEETFPVICRVLRLVLTLPVSTASTERSFSAMKIVKTRLRSSMCDAWMVDLLLLYIEKGLSRDILKVDDVVAQFRDMKSRRL